MKKVLVLFSLLLNFSSTLHSQNLFEPDQFHQLRFAHRGGYSEEWAENTISTIIHNITNLGAQAIEIDIEVTRDNQLVAFHDKGLKKLLETDSKKEINEITLAELRSYPIRGHAGLVVPTLQEIVDTLLFLSKDYTFVLELDFKPTTEPAIIELMRIIIESELKMGENIYNYFFISTFYPSVLESIRKKSSKVVTAFAVHSQPNENKFKAKMAILLAPHFLKKHKGQIIEPNECMVTERFVKKWIKRGILINTYTVNTSCERNYIESLGIAYTTNCISGYCDRDFSGQNARPKKWCKKCN